MQPHPPSRDFMRSFANSVNVLSFQDFASLSPKLQAGPGSSEHPRRFFAVGTQTSDFSVGSSGSSNRRNTSPSAEERRHVGMRRRIETEADDGDAVPADAQGVKIERWIGMNMECGSTGGMGSTGFESQGK